MVRGAYITFEEQNAKISGTENPICDGYEATTEMIDGNIKNLVDNFDH
jgi:hypothetical protein